MRIQLILAADPADPLRKRDPFRPLSLPMLVGAAPDHDYTLVDMLKGDEPLFSADFDLIGISMRMSAETAAFTVADRFRELDVPVVMGGPQASALPLRALEHADVVAVGEGEATWPVILEDTERGALRELYVSSPDGLDAVASISTDHASHDSAGPVVPGCSAYFAPKLPDLFAINHPIREGFRHRYRFEMTFAARGCHVGCDFCAVPGMFGRRYRLRPVEDVVEEIDTFGGYFYLIDDTVFGRPSTYGYYTELYRRIRGLPRRRQWMGQANLDAAGSGEGRAVIDAAARSGLAHASVGIESISLRSLSAGGAAAKSGIPEAVIRSEKHAEGLSRIRESVRYIQEAGIVVSGWFMVGYPGDTVETYHEILDFCEETKILPVVMPLLALPGTPLYHRVASEGRLRDIDSGLSNIENPALPDSRVIRALMDVVKRGYSLRRRFAVTNHYRTLFANYRRGTPDAFSAEEIVRRTIFAWISHAKMAEIFGTEIDALRRKVESAGE